MALVNWQLEGGVPPVPRVPEERDDDGGGAQWAPLNARPHLAGLPQLGTEYRYDERWNYLWKIAYWSFDGGEICNLTRREITYW
jgi:hypothetical protein